ncbi:MAG: CIA30 family protein [Cyclobacteriaceae bacterium]|nr:CIA30 family protein [Cyclobacteriaceae bacterium]
MITTFMNTLMLVDFDKNPNVTNWYVVDDVVMGGRSSSSFRVSSQVYGVFEGKVSLENNGGFSSVRYKMGKTDLISFDKLVIRLKGDGKRYQFRIKARSSDYYSYIFYISTNGEWQTVEILLKDMYPSYRGRKLDIPNFSGESIEELAFLISNKRAESFKLLIDKIELN